MIRNRISIKDKFINYLDKSDEFIVEYDYKNMEDIVDIKPDNLNKKLRFANLSFLKFKNLKNNDKWEIENNNKEFFSNKKNKTKLLTQNKAITLLENKNFCEAYNSNYMENRFPLAESNYINKKNKTLKKNKNIIKINFKAIKNSHLLYKNSLNMKNLKDKRNRDEQLIKQEKEINYCTFTPTTNKTLNKFILDDFNTRQKNWLKSKCLKESENIKLKNKLEVKYCTFKPKTNISSQCISVKDFEKRINNWKEFKNSKNKHIDKISNKLFMLKSNKEYKKLIPNYLNKEKKEIIQITLSLYNK